MERSGAESELKGRNFYKRAKTAEEERLTSARADKIELEIAIKKGEYVELEEVEREWMQLAGRLKSKLLTIPVSLAQRLSTEKDPFEIENLIKEKIVDALRELEKDEKSEPKRTVIVE